MRIKIPFYLPSHTRRICNLYKLYLNDLKNKYYPERLEYRFCAVMMRAEFDAVLKEKDLVKSKRMIEEMEDYYHSYKYPMPMIYPSSPGGVAYNRFVRIPDWILDYWHPLEKAQYPEYFARRELRKIQYIQMWEEKYGRPDEFYCNPDEEVEEHH